jgi:hypothetical protein
MTNDMKPMFDNILPVGTILPLNVGEEKKLQKEVIEFNGYYYERVGNPKQADLLTSNGNYYARRNPIQGVLEEPYLGSERLQVLNEKSHGLEEH